MTVSMGQHFTLTGLAEVVVRQHLGVHLEDAASAAAKSVPFANPPQEFPNVSALGSELDISNVETLPNVGASTSIGIGLRANSETDTTWMSPDPSQAPEYQQTLMLVFYDRQAKH